MWERPNDGDIVALAKLQSMQEQLAREEAEAEAAESAAQAEHQRRKQQQQQQQQQDEEEAQRRRQQQQQQQQQQPMVANGRRATAAAGQGVSDEPTDEVLLARTVSEGAGGSGGRKGPPTAPKPPPAMMVARESGAQLEAFKANLAVHKKGLFRKKVSLHNMLSWSKDMIPNPMLTTLRDKRKEALELFRTVQMYMGDRNAKGAPMIHAFDQHPSPHTPCL